MATELRQRLDGTAVLLPRKLGVPRAERIADEMDEVIQDMSREELVSLKASIEDEMASIRLQLESVRARRQSTGEHADAEWYRRANLALRLKGRQCVRVQNRLTELRQARRIEHGARRTLDLEAFVTTAKRILPGEVYERIWAEVNRDVGAADG